jgi:hypothetical protein
MLRSDVEALELHEVECCARHLIQSVLPVKVSFHIRSSSLFSVTSDPRRKAPVFENRILFCTNQEANSLICDNHVPICSHSWQELDWCEANTVLQFRAESCGVSFQSSRVDQSAQPRPSDYEDSKGQRTGTTTFDQMHHFFSGLESCDHNRHPEAGCVCPAGSQNDER